MMEPIGNIEGFGAERDGGLFSMSKGGDEGGGVQLKKGPWSAEEDAILLDYVNKHGERNWNAVQKLSGLPRCGKSCRVRWNKHLRPHAKEGAFSTEEDRIIVEMDSQFSASCSGEGEMKKGPWTAAEDAILMDYVNKHGEGNWNVLQKRSVLARCGKSCRLRWTNHLRPNLKKGNFSADEERIIVELHAEFGNKWARMAARLPGRTDNEIKNFWNTRAKRLLRNRLPLYPPEIQPQHPPSPLHNNYDNDNYEKSNSMPTTPTFSFTFPTTQLLSPKTPTTPNNPTSPTPVHTLTPPATPSPARTFTPPSTPTPSRTLTPPTTPTPTPTHSPIPTPTASRPSPPPPISPLSSPSTANFPTLPLFDFSLPRAPPVLQTPPRFKHFSRSSSAIATNTTSPNNNVVNTPSTSHNITDPGSYFSLPLSPLPALISPSNTSPLSYQVPSCLTNLLSSNSSDFHKEIERENERMCLLLASMSQPVQLPLTQLLSPTSPNWNLAFSRVPTTTSIPTTTTTTAVHAKISRTRMRRMKNGTTSSKGKRIGKGFGATESTRNGLLQDGLLQEANAALAMNEKNTSTDQNRLIFQDDQQKSKELTLDDFGGVQYWDLSSSLSLSSEFKPTDNGEVAEPLNSSMTEDLTKLLDIFPSSPLQLSDLYTDDISNGQSSVIIDDDNNMDVDMQQQIALLFPTTAADQGSRTVGPGSWDSLPKIF